MKRDYILSGLAWIVLTVITEFLIFQFNLFPASASPEAALIDEAFHLLLVLAAPVFTFVLVGLLYGVLRFRVTGEPAEDGPPIRTNPFVNWLWLAVTSGLAVYVIINPGYTGIRELTRDTSQDLTIKVTASQWQWDFSYVRSGVEIIDANELVLPVDQRVKFEITSKDVIHSFWIPAFRMKIDALPGRTTVMYVTPDELGSFSEDSMYRVQCAELCGTGHPRMRTGLRILEAADFDQWLQENQSSG